MRALIICESSGVVREAFRAKGCDAWSCDLLPADDGSPFHIQGDMREAVKSGGWDFIGAHLPCTYVNGAGNRFQSLWIANPIYSKLVRRTQRAIIARSNRQL